MAWYDIYHLIVSVGAMFLVVGCIAFVVWYLYCFRER